MTQSIRAPVVALCARVLARTTPQPSGAAEPSVVFTWRNAAYWRIEGTEVTVWFWRTVCEALARLAPHVRRRFLVRSWSHVPGRRGPAGLYHGAWRSLRHLDGALPISQAHPAYGVWLTALPAQLRDLWRYVQVERTPGFQESFRFAGADLAPLYVRRLREAVASTARWGQAVASVASSLRAGGNVQAVVVAEELYPTAMVDIAAAHSLDLPVLGVQHATIFPGHLVYTLPAGQVDGAPTPDAFAAYSEFARETLCRHGAYPEERVRVTGATRLDHLSTRPPDRAAARQRLRVDRSARVVLIPTQTAVWFPAAVRVVMEALRTRSDCLICIKIHPKRAAMPADAYRRLAVECGADNVQVHEEGFDEWLAACDVLVAASSTTVLEAILLGRTTICVNFSGEPAWYPYAEDGGSLPGRTPEELRTALVRALDHPDEVGRELDRDGFLRRHAGPTADGQASASLARVLLELMAGGGEPSSGAARSSRAAVGQE